MFFINWIFEKPDELGNYFVSVLSFWCVVHALLSCLCCDRSLQEIQECYRKSHSIEGPGHFDSMAMSMDAEWANQHTVIDEVHPEFSSTSKKKADDHQRCRCIGQRFCKNSMVDNFRIRMTQAVQSFCKSAGNEAAQKKAREEMLEGKWILGFHGKQVFRGDLFPDHDKPLEEPQMETYYLHLAFVLGGLQQFFPVFICLKLISFGDSGDDDDDHWCPRNMRLQAERRILDYHELCLFLNIEYEWSIQVIEFSDDDTVPGYFVPRQISAHRKACPQYLVWKGAAFFKETHRRHGPRPPPAVPKPKPKPDDKDRTLDLFQSAPLLQAEENPPPNHNFDVGHLEALDFDFDFDIDSTTHLESTDVRHSGHDDADMMDLTDQGPDDAAISVGSNQDPDLFDVELEECESYFFDPTEADVVDSALWTYVEALSESEEVGEAAQHDPGQVVQDVGGAPALAAAAPPPPPREDSEKVAPATERRPVIDRKMHDALCVRKDSGGDVISLIKHKPTANDAFVTCSCHANCTKTKTLNATTSTSSRRQGQGRVLGFLAAWALDGHRFASKQEHMQTCNPSFESRKAARTRLHEEPNADAFFALERPKLEGEDSEPEICP